jgi:hypothetical protein
MFSAMGRGSVVTLALAAAIVIGGCSGGSDVQSGSGPSTTQPAGGSDSSKASGSEPTTPVPAEAAPSTSPFLFTQGAVNVPAGDAGKLSVVGISVPAVDSIGATTVPVLVRNNTNTALDGIEVSGTARGPDGSLVGSGSSQNFEPNVLKPGQWGFGYIYFDTSIPPGSKVEATASGDEPGSDLFDRIQLTINELNLVPGEFESSSYVGILSNTNGKKAVSGPSVTIGCFDAASNLLDVFTGYADGEAVPGGTASFSVDLYEAPACAAVVAAASGYES